MGAIWLGSCILGKMKYIIPRLVIGVFVQVLCSYSTLPLYAIVTQMGSKFKKPIFEELVQVGILGWRAKVKKKKGLSLKGSPGSSSTVSRTASAPVNATPTRTVSTPAIGTPSEGSGLNIQLGKLAENNEDEIQPSKD